MYRIFVLSVSLEARYKTLDLEQSSDETAREVPRLVSDMAEQPEPVQEALTKWMRDRGCGLADVPVILATEAYIRELVGELERVFYREKSGIIVAEGNFRWLLERLADKYETETGLADHLHVEMFTQLPDVLRRARTVRPLVLSQAVSGGLDHRYKEAVRSYLSGHAIACCVLCRAVVEAALKETFGDKRLSDLIERSSKVLPGHVVESCRQVKSLGDKAVHKENVLSLDEAYQALTATRQVLNSVFVQPLGDQSPA